MPAPPRALLRPHESGQAAVLVTLALAVLLGFAALVIDLGYAYYAKRSLQASADAAALAGAQELPNEAVAVSVARGYGGSAGKKNERANVPGVSSTVNALCRPESPCKPVNAVEVTESADVKTGFAKLFGIETIHVSARAVAAIRRGAVPWAIFAYDTDCGSLVLKSNGNVVEIEGGIRSNGSFEINGMNISAGFASAGGPNNCEPKIDAEHVDFGGSPEPEIDTTLHDWPAYFTESEFPCTYKAKKFTFNKHNETIPSGVYCASETFEANANHLTGQITVLAPEIKVDGNNQQLSPFLKDVLFFATGTKEMILNGNSYNWTGIVFHPKGRIKINGNDESMFNGLIEGLEVEINGNAFAMVGTGPGTTKKIIALVE